MASMHAPAVPGLGRVDSPVGAVRVIKLGSTHGQYGLNVAVAQAGVGLQHQRNDAADDRCCKAGAL